jgi:2-dehydropantoate 2-reductase
MKELQIFLDLGRSKGLDLRGPCEDIQSYRWQKLLWNCSFNSLSILCGELTCDVMLQDPDCVALVRSIMVEVTEAAERVLKKPFPKEFDSIDRLLEITKKIGKYKPSMLLDWQAKRPLEIQVILGNPIEIAKKHGYTMAHLQTIFHMLKVKLHTRSS